jgi:S1-C subfamily serine protease
VFPRSTAASAGLLAGDIVVAIDQKPLSRPTATTPADIIPLQMANRSAGSVVRLGCLRNGARLDFDVPLEARPRTAEEQPRYEDGLCEYTVRNLAHEDRLKLVAPTDIDGLFVDKVVPNGWAALEGLREGDLILAANGAPVRSVAEFQKLREDAQRSGATRWILISWRAGATRLHEISLKNISS